MRRLTHSADSLESVERGSGWSPILGMQSPGIWLWLAYWCTAWPCTGAFPSLRLNFRVIRHKGWILLGVLQKFQKNIKFACKRGSDTGKRHQTPLKQCLCVYMYTAVPGLGCSPWALFYCGMQGLFPWPGVEPEPLFSENRILATESLEKSLELNKL